MLNFMNNLMAATALEERVPSEAVKQSSLRVGTLWGLYILVCLLVLADFFLMILFVFPQVNFRFGCSVARMRPVFVGNFEYDTRQSELERLFAKYGRIERVDMKSGNYYCATSFVSLPTYHGQYLIFLPFEGKFNFVPSFPVHC